ncbi:MAG: hypothetical protein JW958_12920 [Candidatus Eisenbacteria bacterium]|nr:hypothetical protein [Candidatus Eisenbacteria bacterium]
MAFFARKSARAALVAAALAAALRLSGCLDAGPLDPAGEAGLDVRVQVFSGDDARKTQATDSLSVRLYDITGDRYTDEPESFPLAARADLVSQSEDAVYRAPLRVDLTEERVFRVATRFSYVGAIGREKVAGERTVTLAPGDRKNLTMVLTEPGAPPADAFGLSVANSEAVSGARDHGLPIVLKNGAAIGGLQFQIRFDGRTIESVEGIEVDPSSRLFTGASADSLIGSHFAQPTDSTLRVVTVDLRGDSLFEPLQSIPPGNDLLFFVRVDLGDQFPVLPDTIRLSLEDVFFSTPSGSSDIAVTDTTNGLLIITE